MPRQARIVVPGLAHHVRQRSLDGWDAFQTDHDRSFYLRALTQQSDAFGLAVIGYCLMPDHVHLIAVPDSQSSLAKAIGSANLRYARYANRTQGRRGHLWQDRFFSCPIESAHRLAALRYVERNPIRAGLVDTAHRYRWSSAAAHDSGRDASKLLDLRTWRRWTSPGQWRRFVTAPDDAGFVGSMRHQTFNGQPLGSDRFVDALEKRLDRRLRSEPVGRPPKRRAS